ncbi:MAG TPA: 23S rRNA (guanosine(2251)-2'-O)-methyltransferase RlmB [Rhizomicrobium sp.]|nr:23S rRNA (guanosine(2251)-2'-O)-methyltransferase RlmB [Rhizomicrobium sp.]
MGDTRKRKRPHWTQQRGAAAPGLWLYGHHAVEAALRNSKRKAKRLVLTERAAEMLGKGLVGRVKHEIVDADAVSRLLPPGAVHQGVALECEPLPQGDIAHIAAAADGRRRIVLVLDQISDPQNTGAILRSAAAFGVSAVVVQDRHAPPESGALAKAASGALDIVPYITVVNIARALKELSEHGFWRVGLAGDGEQTLKEAVSSGDIALVLGSEGSGIRRLVRENCDVAAYVPVETQMESLNVSNAAAVALYECRRG